MTFYSNVIYIFESNLVFKSEDSLHRKRLSSFFYLPLQRPYGWNYHSEVLDRYSAQMG